MSIKTGHPFQEINLASVLFGPVLGLLIQASSGIKGVSGIFRRIENAGGNVG